MKSPWHHTTLTTMFAVIMFELCFLSVCSEWVEVKIVNSEMDNFNYRQSTVPTNYEVIMKAPIFTTTTRAQIQMTKSPVNNLKDKLGPKEIDTVRLTNQSFNKPQNDGTKTTSLGFLSFLNSIQKNLLDYKEKTINSKLTILKRLRDHLLLEIQNRITIFWNPMAFSEARTYKEDDHQMDYPSNEGALMTIGFLTFAVFLIKLVLKLIYLIKYKKQYYYSTTTTTTPASVFLKKRDVSEYNGIEADKILQYIEAYQL